MKQETINKLMGGIPEMKELLVFIATEAQKLDNLSDIDIASPIDLAVEVRARQLAHKKLVDILHPLLDTQEKGSSLKDEYIV